MHSQSGEDVRRPTMDKNSWSDFTSWNVLEEDQHYVLALLDEAVHAVTRDGRLTILITMTKFGQKDKTRLDVGSLANVRHVRNVSIHAAAVVASKDERTHLLWSRLGLEEIGGRRGSYYPALSMHEAANFSSNLDGKSTDWSGELQSLLVPRDISFIQCYVDAPHRHDRHVFKHPVTGCIATLGLAHPSSHASMRERATRYVKLVEQLTTQMTGQLRMRIEAVAVFSQVTGIPSLLHASECFRQPALIHLLSTRPLAVPFRDDRKQQGLLRVCREVLGGLTELLKKLQLTRHGLGGFMASWTAYQAEMAIEQLIWGHPLSPMDKLWSVSLGTDAVNPNSLSHRRGFLGLSPANSATMGCEPPPLENWTKDRVQILRIERLFALCDSLQAAPSVVGEAMVRIIIQDLLMKNEGIPFGQLQSPNPPGGVKGPIPADTLATDLATKEGYFPFPSTFGRARTILRDHNVDVKEALLAGFEDMKLKWFPAITYYDTKRVKRLAWDGKLWLEVLRPGQTPCPQSRVAETTLAVCVEIERLGLSWAKNLQVYRDHGMPWLEKCMARMPSGLQPAPRLALLTFLSCVAMLMNGDYVSYAQVEQLIKRLPVTQARMQTLKILSNYTLSRICSTMVWRLHEDIPHKVRVTPAPRVPATKRSAPEEEPDEQLVEDVQEVHFLLPT